MTAPFDTLAFANRLEIAGLAPDVAKAVSSAMAEVAMAEMASKSDVREAVHALTIRGIAGLATLGGLILAGVALIH